ncbi:MAG TPA: hypothetical protein VHE81_09320 [Lacipirellulaceae bacterium]|nr:hypothetical protein [Lacipirellulaceae bacterium]
MEGQEKRSIFKTDSWVGRAKENENRGDSLGLRNYDPITIMRNSLRRLIHELQISEEEQQELVSFIQDAPEHILREICHQAGTCVRAAERTYWEAKLEEFIDNEPPKYKTQKSEFRNPPQFLKEVWGEFIKRGVLYLDRLTDYDPRLVPSVRRYWQLHGHAPDDVPLPLPHQKRKGDVLSHVTAAGPFSVDDVIRAAMAERRSRQRQRQNNLG